MSVRILRASLWSMKTQTLMLSYLHTSRLSGVAGGVQWLQYVFFRPLLSRLSTLCLCVVSPAFFFVDPHHSGVWLCRPRPEKRNSRCMAGFRCAEYIRAPSPARAVKGIERLGWAYWPQSQQRLCRILCPLSCRRHVRGLSSLEWLYPGFSPFLFAMKKRATSAQASPPALLCYCLTWLASCFSVPVLSNCTRFFFFVAAADRPLHHPHLQGCGEDERRCGCPPPWRMSPRCRVVLPLVLDPSCAVVSCVARGARFSLQPAVQKVGC